MTTSLHRLIRIYGNDRFTRFSGAILGTGKMGPKLRELKTDDHLLLLCTDMDQVMAVNLVALNRTKA